MSFYAALIDLLGRCAPEMHVRPGRLGWTDGGDGHAWPALNFCIQTLATSMEPSPCGWPWARQCWGQDSDLHCPRPHLMALPVQRGRRAVRVRGGLGSRGGGLVLGALGVRPLGGRPAVPVSVPGAGGREQSPKGEQVLGDIPTPYPPPQLIQAGKGEALRIRAILRSLVPLDDLVGIISLPLQIPTLGKGRRGQDWARARCWGGSQWAPRAS